MVVDFYVGFVAKLVPVCGFGIGCCVKGYFGLRCCRYEEVGLGVFGVNLEFEDIGGAKAERPVLCHCVHYSCWRYRI